MQAISSREIVFRHFFMQDGYYFRKNMLGHQDNWERLVLVRLAAIGKPPAIITSLLYLFLLLMRLFRYQK